MDCDRSRERYGPSTQTELAIARTSHYERMLVAYGRTNEEALEVARGAGGKRPPADGSGARSAAELAVDLVRCPRHRVPEGEDCPRGGACPQRMKAAAAAAARRRRPCEPEPQKAGTRARAKTAGNGRPAKPTASQRARSRTTGRTRRAERLPKLDLPERYPACDCDGTCPDCTHLYVPVMLTCRKCKSKFRSDMLPTCRWGPGPNCQPRKQPAAIRRELAEKGVIPYCHDAEGGRIPAIYVCLRARQEEERARQKEEAARLESMRMSLPPLHDLEMAPGHGATGPEGVTRWCLPDDVTAGHSSNSGAETRVARLAALSDEARRNSGSGEPAEPGAAQVGVSCREPGQARTDGPPPVIGAGTAEDLLVQALPLHWIASPPAGRESAEADDDLISWPCECDPVAAAEAGEPDWHVSPCVCCGGLRDAA